MDAHWLPGKVWYGDYDPEGLLSTLPAIASSLFGLFAGRWLKAPDVESSAKLRQLILAGCFCLVLGYAWGLQFPLIKRIWTSSYALVGGGWSLLLLAAFYQLIDRRGIRSWATPFVWIGSNALLIYLVSHLVDFRRVSAFFVGGPVAAALDGVWRDWCWHSRVSGCARRCVACFMCGRFSSACRTGRLSAWRRWR